MLQRYRDQGGLRMVGRLEAAVLREDVLVGGTHLADRE